jgi:nucleotide-binding universal stress UspA family protein
MMHWDECVVSGTPAIVRPFGGGCNMKVLIATDGSKNAEDAVRFLRTIASPNWEYKLVAVQMSVVVGMYDEMTHSMLLEGETERTKRALERCAGILKEAGITTEIEQGLGHAGDEIVRMAGDWKAELIVVGAKGHSTIERVLLGSTSDFVATHASCSVLVVRPSAVFNAGEVGTIGKLLIPFDDCDAARTALVKVGRYFHSTKAHVELYHVIERPALHDETVRFDPAWAESIKVKMEESKVGLGTELADNATTKVEEAGYISEKICERLHDENFDLVAIGERGRSTISRIFLGSNSRYVLRHSPCSVLLVR